MIKRLRVRCLVVLLITLVARWPANAQAPPQPSDADVYAHFRAWVSSAAVAATRTDANAEVDLLQAYRKLLVGDGVAAAEADRRVRVIRDNARRLEIDMWNRMLTSPTPAFNVQPNAFLVRAIKGVRAGTALDYGMGQGRNAIYLAQQGWTVTGFDPAVQAVAAAQEQAGRLGVKISTLAIGDEQFEFGQDQWDLIVLSYVGFRGTLPRLYESLKPGGRIVVEAFHRDSLKNGPIGAGVVFDTNELLTLFARYRVIHYEDAEDTSDFGNGINRVVRLVAQKR